MIILPAIDLYGGKVVRLLKGDYENMTVYSDDPVEVAGKFAAAGAEYIHIVDLEGAKNGNTPALPVVKRIIGETGLKAEVGGGIRDMDAIGKYISGGAFRVILGTAAVNDAPLLSRAVAEYGGGIAVGADVKDGYIAIKGWVEKSELTLDDFLGRMMRAGVKAVICTDISKDGAMNGTNIGLYRTLSERYPLDITASGGVSSLDEITVLKKMKLWGAIIGKAYYTGAIDIREAIEAAK